MPVYVLGDELVFPPVDGAEDGLVAVGGDLSTERLLLAYKSGLFPWYEEG
ncbi:MAG: leucyl/phenylalanyl-tRNA--protein transferase, partial [Acidobacteria bacterium]|nr:leucyl/phenylalanyl-tRNA--protein transferase [Acidobacteriota bacterium]NIM62011.1 leucyl/phenylalanyl-tRNA--protein transferase [Acidobacteriota bacterium]NIO60031.1 leucyl/phenylalanyl-tRNA--protein transferase [Acidobacteriota bacterium]NIQ30791.1 leucyl/phenylalanyl-tRNA--protein transferase [Acidobacteriota bacterium]NIQ85831.1 leucyl/phenylalanyl-tRNA--protein transferase [Acidobacteriota bacterium]